VEAKAKAYFLKKISINGFSIREENNTLTLSPRGMGGMGEIAIEEKEPNVWTVTRGWGRYAGFARGQKRLYFETYLKGWVAEAVLQAGGETLEVPQAPG
jgi:hypothetical protein